MIWTAFSGSGVEGIAVLAFDESGGVAARVSLRGWIAGTREGSVEYHLQRFF